MIKKCVTFIQGMQCEHSANQNIIRICTIVFLMMNLVTDIIIIIMTIIDNNNNYNEKTVNHISHQAQLHSIELCFIEYT